MGRKSPPRTTMIKQDERLQTRLKDFINQHGSLSANDALKEYAACGHQAKTNGYQSDKVKELLQTGKTICQSISKSLEEANAAQIAAQKARQAEQELQNITRMIANNAPKPHVATVAVPPTSQSEEVEIPRSNKHRDFLRALKKSLNEYNAQVPVDAHINMDTIEENVANFEATGDVEQLREEIADSINDVKKARSWGAYICECLDTLLKTVSNLFQQLAKSTSNFSFFKSTAEQTGHHADLFDNDEKQENQGPLAK